MDNGIIVTEEKNKQYQRIVSTLEAAQEKLKEVKYRGTYPTLYDFLNWSLKNSEHIMRDIAVLNSIDNKIILSRKLFEIYLSIKVTKNNAKIGIDRDKLVPKFIISKNKKIDIKRLCTDVNVEKEFYSFYSIFAHPYTYSRPRFNDDGLDINTSQMLYYINDYEYQINEMNQYLLIYVIADMIDDINYIIKRVLSNNEDSKLECYIVNKEMMYQNAISILNKLNKRLKRKSQ